MSDQHGFRAHRLSSTDKAKDNTKTHHHFHEADVASSRRMRHRVDPFELNREGDPPDG